MHQERIIEEKREAKIRGSRKEFARNREEVEGRARAKKDREGREEKIGTQGRERHNHRENRAHTG